MGKGKVTAPSPTGKMERKRRRSYSYSTGSVYAIVPVLYHSGFLMLLVGCVFAAIGGLCFPGINIAFRNMMDSTAASATSSDQTKNAVMWMEIVALTLGLLYS